jgi:hypothetical protein
MIPTGLDETTPTVPRMMSLDLEVVMEVATT